MTSTKSEEESNRRLIIEIAKGDPDALRELYRGQGYWILAYLSNFVGDPLLAEELLQDVMLAVWKSAAQFQARSSVRTWLLSIARHKAINTLHRKQIPQSDLDDTLAVEDDYEQETSYFALAHVQETLDYLSIEQRETLELIFFQDLSAKEVAEVLAVPVGTVKTRLYRALLTLRRLMRRELIEDV